MIKLLKFIALAIIPILILITAAPAQAGGNHNYDKVKLCHKTSSQSNPWVEIEVNENAVLSHLAHGDYINLLGNCSSPFQTGPVGPPGPQGPIGPKGPKGEQGPVGPKGPKGDTGPQGPQGEPGKDGKDGTTPHIGNDGDWWIGDVDTNVPATGPAGSDGKDGINGEDGVNGKNGETGPQGAVGPNGPATQSSTQIKGDKGDRGAPGKRGKRGVTRVVHLYYTCTCKGKVTKCKAVKHPPNLKPRTTG